MAKKNKNKSGFQITPSMVFLNLSIILFVFIVCFFVYNVTRNDMENQSKTNSTHSADITAESTVSISAETSGLETSVTTETVTSVTETSGSDVTSVEETSTEDTSDNTSTVQLSTEFDKEFFADDLFIGDSISTGLSLYGFLDSSQVCAQTGLNPESALTAEVDGATILDTIKTKKPKRVFIMLGTNGMGFFSASYMADEMALMVDKIKATSGETKIFIISIPPVTTEAEAEENGLTMAKVNEYNSLLKKTAAAAQVAYIDICSMLQDSDGYFSADYAEQDGIHFMGVTYQVVLSYLQKSIG